MTASLGIWAAHQVSSGVVYRWTADNDSGYALLDTATATVSPCTSDGHAIGDLRIDTAADQPLTGHTDGVNLRLFIRVAAAISGPFRLTGKPPETAHKNYF
jgi:hypothetical protein